MSTTTASNPYEAAARTRKALVLTGFIAPFLAEFDTAEQREAFVAGITPEMWEAIAIETGQNVPSEATIAVVSVLATKATAITERDPFDGL